MGCFLIYKTILVLLLNFMMMPQKHLKIFIAGDSTASIKEETAFPETGWGMPFVHFWNETVEVINLAKNGRSTKTFINEGLWDSIENKMREGDYVLIQFGHNDESKEKKERYTSPDEYKANLKKFISETRQRKAIPILLTPVSRRKFDKNGNIMETHMVYSALVIEVAGEQNVSFIDLDEKSRQLYQQLGEDDSGMLFLQLNPGEHPNYPDGKIDNTHFNELGARMIAQIVLQELKKVQPKLIDRVLKPRLKK